MVESWLPERQDNVITIPHNYYPYEHQWNLWQYFQQERPGLRGVAVWHRRAGKDLSAINLLGAKAMQRRGLYWHVFPTYEQGKKIAWDGMTSDGDRFIDTFPKALIKSVNNTAMKVELEGGSIYQVIGAEDPDRLVGTNPVGVILSEWSLMNPKVWEYIEPILLANGGWALFIYTPRGRNHGYTLYKNALEDPNWYCEKYTIRDTKKPDGSPIISEEDVEEIRKKGRPEEIIQQEYYCSFDASLVGAYYGQQMKRAHDEGRIRSVPYDPFAPVHTGWDIGMDDETAIWFFQEIRNELHWIDYYSNSGEGLAHYIGVLKNKEYAGNYGQHWAPHDIKVRELGTGKSRWETAMRLGIRFEICPKLEISDGIEACRQIIPISWFDSTKCAVGIQALCEYTKEYDDKKGVYKNKPLHDRHSHAADGFRTAAVAFRNRGLRRSEIIKSVHAITDYDILEY